MIGNAEDRLDLIFMKDTDPADTNAFGARRKPEVLHGTDGGIEIHLRVMGAPENDRSTARAVAGDADAQGCLADPLQLQGAVFRLAVAIEHQCRFVVGAGKGLPYPLAGFGLPDHDEIPRLHETHRWRPVRSIEQAHHHIVRQGFGQELIPHVPARFDGSIDGFALVG
ncbi:hypothetical protein ASD52_15310 [Ensifer sp. Root142]|nr:hypothetical protein ASD00_06440 [Ensifer sp. Root31]KQY62010.1 hypothetical protein ASD52_15310 [Ensifer sp. Root142]OMQ46170.1 hypothetical protein BKP54_03850 [Ensifer sp. 1H6]